MGNQNTNIFPLNSSRRFGTYYPVKLHFSFVSLREDQVIQTGEGEIAEMSSTHIKVKRIDILDPRATNIVLSIAWPAKLPDGAPLQLLVHATMPARMPAEPEFDIRKWEFRTVAKTLNGFHLRAGAGTWATRSAREIRHDPQPEYRAAASVA